MRGLSLEEANTIIAASAPLVDPRPKRKSPPPGLRVGGNGSNGNGLKPQPRKPNRQTGAVIFAEGACRGDDFEKKLESSQRYENWIKPPTGEGRSV